MNLTIKPIKSTDEKVFEKLYTWTINDPNFEYYTDRPIQKYKNFKEYYRKYKMLMKAGAKFYVFVDEEKNEIYGNIHFLDYNPRNYSAEFGYYVPQKYRKKGIASIMIEEFLTSFFADNDLNLNKLFASTSSGNIASIKLLEKFDFTLEGRCREHFWIGDERQDQLIYSLLRREWEK